jgi:hypothetical protein
MNTSHLNGCGHITSQRLCGVLLRENARKVNEFSMVVHLPSSGKIELWNFYSRQKNNK